MKNNKKGSLLIGITLLSIVLLIIMMSIFNLNRKDAELITMKGDKEKSFQASNVGLRLAAKDIEDKIAKKIDDDEDITWSQLYNLEGHKSKEVLKQENEIHIKKDTDYDNYTYKYDYEKGKITAKGTYNHKKSFGKEKDDTNSHTTLTANYIMDYVGIQAGTINEYVTKKDNDFSAPGIKAIYSYETQYPMRPWINLYNYKIKEEDNQNRDVKEYVNRITNKESKTKTEDILSNGYVTKYPAPVGLYDFLNNDDKINLVDKIFDMCSALELKELDSENNKLFVDDNLSSSTMVFKAEGNEEKKQVRQGILEKLIGGITNISKILYRKAKIQIKVYDTFGGFLSNTQYRNGVAENLGLNPNKPEQIAHCLKRVRARDEYGNLLKDDKGNYVYERALYKLVLDNNDNDDTDKLDDDTYKKMENSESQRLTTDDSDKKIYRLVGRNIMLIPLKSTVVIDGDLILEPTEKNKKYYKTVYDLNKDEQKNSANYSPDIVNGKIGDNLDMKRTYPVLFVTGNLIVNGSIKGIGTVISMKNIIINDFPYEKPDISQVCKFKSGLKDKDEYKKYYEDLEKGAIIIHANNNLVLNTINLNQYLNLIDMSRLEMNKQNIKGKNKQEDYGESDKDSNGEIEIDLEAGDKLPNNFTIISNSEAAAEEDDPPTSPDDSDSGADNGEPQNQYMSGGGSSQRTAETK